MNNIYKLRRILNAGVVAVIIFCVRQTSYAILTVSNSPAIIDPSVPGLGWSVDVSGNLAIFGSPFTNFGQGAAVVYDLITGSRLFELHGSDANYNSLFGSSVAIDGNRAVVGCQQQQAAYVFDLTTGNQIQKLSPSNPAYLAGFGYSVAISGDLAIVGAAFGGTGLYHDQGGSAFIFNLRTGQQLRIDASSSFIDDFGAAVAISGDTAVIGAPNTFPKGTVFAYDAFTGTEKWRYDYPEGSSFEPFGRDIAIDGELVAVAASLLGGDMPEILIFDRRTGQRLNRIDTHIGVPNDDNKRDMDLSDGRVIVGSFGTSRPGGKSLVGDATVFDALSGIRLFSLTRDSQLPFDAFGFSVAIDKMNALVGSPGQSFSGVYTFIVPEPSAMVMLGIAAFPHLLTSRRCCVISRL